MITCGNWPVGLCSWSLQTDVAGVAEVMADLGLNHVNLAVRQAVGEDGKDYLEFIKKQDWVVSCTMLDFEQEDYSTLDTIKVTGGVVPDDSWEKNKELFAGAAEVTKQLGVECLAFHAGFIDHTDVEKYKVMCERIKCLADIAAENGIMLLMETGQESAADLAGFIKDIDHKSVGINFDPANMILYDKGNPIEALKILAPWVKHIHVKDAKKTAEPGTWGSEEVWGTGQVGEAAFLTALKEIGYNGALAIEREAGDNRKGDIKIAVERLTAYSKS